MMRLTNTRISNTLVAAFTRFVRYHFMCSHMEMNANFFLFVLKLVKCQYLAIRRKHRFQRNNRRSLQEVVNMYEKKKNKLATPATIHYFLMHVNNVLIMWNERKWKFSLEINCF